MVMLYCSLKYWMTPMLRSGAPSRPFIRNLMSAAAADEMRLMENCLVDLLATSAGERKPNSPVGKGELLAIKQLREATALLGSDLLE